MCWVVDDDDSYREAATEVLRDAAARGGKPVVFGPEGSGAWEQLARLAAVAADPRLAFLGGGRLDPPAMFRMFREQTAVVRARRRPPAAGHRRRGYVHGGRLRDRPVPRPSPRVRARGARRGAR